MLLTTGHKLLLSLFACVLLYSCKKGTPDKKYKNTAAYDFAQPRTYDLPEALDEISGIAYYPKDTSVFAIIDEDGLFFKIPLKSPENTRQWTFDKPRDYEDLVLRDSTFYVLVGKGDVLQLEFTRDEIKTTKIDFPGGSKATNEFEAMYDDPISGKLVIVCKECDADPKDRVSTYYPDFPGNTFSQGPGINTGAIVSKAPGIKGRIKPSGAAVHPKTRDLYVLSSTDKVLAIYDSGGTLKEVIELNPKIYKQPEGITFTPEGHLIISNEVYLEGYGQLLVLKNKIKH